MPINNVSKTSAASSAADKGPGGGGRTTFRPPWVKESKDSPQAPWTKRNVTETPTKENGQLTTANATKEVKLQSKEVKVPITSVTKKTIPTLSKKPKVTSDEESDEVVKKPIKKLVKTTEKDNDEEKPKLAVTLKSVSNRDAPAAVTKKEPGALEKPGKFVKPVLKKVARPEPAPLPPAGDRTTPIKPTWKTEPKKEESDEESEEESSEEETDTETETETESEEEDTVGSSKKVCK